MSGLHAWVDLVFGGGLLGAWARRGKIVPLDPAKDPALAVPAGFLAKVARPAAWEISALPPKAELLARQSIKTLSRWSGPEATMQPRLKDWFHDQGAYLVWSKRIDCQRWEERSSVGKT